MSKPEWKPGSREPYDWDPGKYAVYGRGLLAGLGPELLARPLVLTQPEPWELVKKDLLAAGSPTVHLCESIDHAETKARSDAWGELKATVVIGLGGGMALDHAKFTAWHLKLPLVLVPSILSVDAGFTRAVGVREEGRVKYVGDAGTVLRSIFIDYDLLQAAPAILNSAGAGDILSCFTALWDWKRSAEELGEDYDAEMAATVQRNCLDRLYAGATGLRDQTEDGPAPRRPVLPHVNNPLSLPASYRLKMLAELFIEEVRLCEQWGNARLEEGSEHYIGYALEAVTGAHYIHGQLIGMCVLLAATYQGQDVAQAAACLAGLGLDCSFAAVKTSREEVRGVLLGMAEYVAKERQLIPGVFHFKGSPSETEADRMLDAVDRHFPGPAA